MWLVPRQDLSADQAAAVGLDISRHRVLHGGPGSGKTLVLAHRAKALIEERGLPRERVRLLVYTNVLGDYLGQGLADLGLADICMGFDAWCRDQLREWGMRIPRGERGIDHAEVRRLVRKELAELDEPPLDALLVDEAQDLDEDGVAILRLAARHVTVAMDSRQQLYSSGVSSQELAEALGVSRRQPTLLTAYRCTPHIVALAATFLDDPVERHTFRASNLMPIALREQPVAFTWKSREDEYDALVAELGQRAKLNQQSLVLLPSKRAVSRYVRELRSRGMSVKDRHDVGFDGTPIVLTYHSAKGLTCDAVFLPDLGARSFFGLNDEQIARMLFVGVTRATHWVWLGMPSQPLPMLGRLDDLVASGDVKRRSTATTAAPAPRVAGSGGASLRRSPAAAGGARSTARPVAPVAPAPAPNHDDLLDLIG